MSFNIAKAKRNAERYLTQGKIQAAIGEYRQIVDHDAKDINTQNMLGDLYVKSKNNDEAVKCYQRVADYYNGQGFAKKAIAVYNKIYKINPDSMEISSKLADLYRNRGSFAEAKVHYDSLANRYESKGQRAEALAMWENIAELDPNNAEIYVKIADSYWQDNRADEAAESFVKAGSRLADSNNHESAVASFSRALEILPTNSDAMDGLVKSQIELGYPEEAAKALELRIASDPYDRAINFLLVDCYYEMENPAAAENVIVKMVERDPSNYRKFLELVDVYLKCNDLDSAVRCLSMITEHMLVGGEHEELLEQLEEVLARNPEHIAALRLLTRYHGWLKDEIELKAALERVVESSRINGALEDEVYGLSQLSLIVPHDQKIANRLAELKGEMPVDVSPLPTETPTGEVPEFKSYAVLSDDGDGDDNGFAEVNHSDSQETSLEHHETGFEIEGKDGETISTAGESETLEAELVPEAEAEDEIQGTFQEGEASGSAMDGDGAEPDASRNNGQTEETSQKSAVEAGNDTSNAGPDKSEFDTLNAADELRLEEELASIRFYLEQGYSGLAEKSIRELVNEFGNRPEIAELNGVPVVQSESPSDLLNHDEPENIIEKAADLMADGNESGKSQAKEVETAAEAAISDQPSSEASSEFTAEESAEAENGEDEALDANEMSSGESEEFQTSEDQVENSDHKVEIAGAPGETAPSDSVEEKTEDKKDLSNSYENFRDELGLEESEAVEEDDFDNHYHHAVAYQEMGLLEEAIREFQDAVNAVEPNDGTKRFLNCCTLLGHCFLEKGMPNLSVVWFERAFETPDLSSDEHHGLKYELANAYAENGETESAMAEFEKIYALDVDFRDVGDRIEKLRELVPTMA